MSTESVLKTIADEDIEYVDIRFTDPRGKLQHVTVMSDQVDADFIEEGFMFDGSSIAGWKSIEASDMKLMMDTNSAYVDPFYAEKTLCVHCSVVEPDTGEAYERDPRGTAQKAEAYLKSSGIGDVAYFGPEAEFFLFDDVRFSNSINKVSYEVDALDASWNTDTEYEMGNIFERFLGGFDPRRYSVLQEPTTVQGETISPELEGIVLYRPGVYKPEPGLGMPPAIAGGIDFFKQFIDQPVETAKAAGKGQTCVHSLGMDTCR